MPDPIIAPSSEFLTDEPELNDSEICDIDVNPSLNGEQGIEAKKFQEELQEWKIEEDEKQAALERKAREQEIVSHALASGEAQLQHQLGASSVEVVSNAMEVTIVEEAGQGLQYLDENNNLHELKMEGTFSIQPVETEIDFRGKEYGGSVKVYVGSHIDQHGRTIHKFIQQTYRSVEEAAYPESDISPEQLGEVSEQTEDTAVSEEKDNRAKKLKTKSLFESLFSSNDYVEQAPLAEQSLVETKPSIASLIENALSFSTTEAPQEKPWSWLEPPTPTTEKPEQLPVKAEQSIASLFEKTFSISPIEAPMPQTASVEPTVTVTAQETSVSSFFQEPNISPLISEYAQPGPESAQVSTSEAPTSVSQGESHGFQPQVPLTESTQPTSAVYAAPTNETPRPPVEFQSNPISESQPSPTNPENPLFPEAPITYAEKVSNQPDSINTAPLFTSTLAGEKGGPVAETAATKPEVYEASTTLTEQHMPREVASQPAERLAAPSQSMETVEYVPATVENGVVMTESNESPHSENASETMIYESVASSVETIESLYVVTSSETIVAAVEQHLQPVAAINFEPSSHQEAEPFLQIVEPALAEKIEAAIEQVKTQTEVTKIVITTDPEKMTPDSAIIVNGNEKEVSLQLFAAEEAPLVEDSSLVEEATATVIIEEAPAENVRVIEISSPSETAESLVVSLSSEEASSNRNKKEVRQPGREDEISPELADEQVDQENQPLGRNRRTQVPFSTLPITNNPSSTRRANTQRASQAA